MSNRDKLREIARLHDEAFAKWMTVNGTCKRAEGQMTLQLTSVDDRREGTDPLSITGVGIYAYVVGPSRQHWFDSIDEALAAVREWHREAMEWKPETEAA